MWILLALQVTASSGQGLVRNVYHGWSNLGTFATQEQCNNIAKELSKQESSVRAFVCASEK